MFFSETKEFSGLKPGAFAKTLSERELVKARNKARVDQLMAGPEKTAIGEAYLTITEWLKKGADRISEALLAFADKEDSKMKRNVQSRVNSIKKKDVV